MAVKVTQLHGGGANFVLHVFMEQDGGLGGELENYVLVDPVDYGLPKHPALRLMGAWHSLAWFDATLKYGGLVPRPIWTFARDGANHVNFDKLGGLSDRGDPPPSDDNGKVLVSTSGFATLGSQGSLVLAFRKG